MKFEMIFRISSLLVIVVCLLLPYVASARNKFRFWDLFQRVVDRYDKDVENKANRTTEEWIRNANLPCEIHELTTEDGYVLSLHRIPKPGYQPVLLVHGFMTSSLSFVMLGEGNSLAFQFASNNYDTWLANTRGTVQSRKHLTISSASPRFWKYSFHEVGLYDISATIDFIRNTTNFHQVVYIGHSQGATALFALCSRRPEYNDRIALMHAFAPVVFLKNFTKIGKSELSLVKSILKEKIKSNSPEIMAQEVLLEKCSIKSRKQSDCLQTMYDILGPSHYNGTLDPIVLGSAIAGGSVQEIQHYLQILKSGDFVAFDYGLNGNRRVYNQLEPDGYNLSKVIIPIIFHYGRSDVIAPSLAVHKLYQTLPNTLGLYPVPTGTFNHYDFVWSQGLRNLLNANVVRLCEEFFRGALKYHIE